MRGIIGFCSPQRWSKYQRRPWWKAILTADLTRKPSNFLRRSRSVPAGGLFQRYRRQQDRQRLRCEHSSKSGGTPLPETALRPKGHCSDEEYECQLRYAVADRDAARARKSAQGASIELAAACLAQVLLESMSLRASRACLVTHPARVPVELFLRPTLPAWDRQIEKM